MPDDDQSINNPTGTAVDAPVDTPVTTPIDFTVENGDSGSSADIGVVPVAPTVGNVVDEAADVPANDQVLPPAPAIPVQNLPTAPAPVAAPAANPSVADKFLANMANWKEHLQEALAGKKKKEFDNIAKVLALAQSKGKITSVEVELHLHCSDVSALKYLNTLVSQNSLRRVGNPRSPSAYYVPN